MNFREYINYYYYISDKLTSCIFQDTDSVETPPEPFVIANQLSFSIKPRTYIFIYDINRKLYIAICIYRFIYTNI